MPKNAIFEKFLTFKAFSYEITMHPVHKHAYNMAYFI